MNIEQAQTKKCKRKFRIKFLTLACCMVSVFTVETIRGSERKRGLLLPFCVYLLSF